MKKDKTGLKIVKRLLKTRGLKKEKIEEEDGVVDALVHDSKKRKKILIRVVTKSELKSNSVGIGQVQKMDAALKEKKVNQGILIGKKFTSSARRRIEKLGIEHIKLATLKTFNIFDHFLVPKHEILPEKEAEKLLKKYRVKRYQLPLIKRSDPAIKAIGGKRGNIIKITRKSPTAGQFVVYRYVI